MLDGRFPLVVYFLHSSLYVSIPISQFIPPPPLHLRGISFFSVMEVSKYKNEKGSMFTLRRQEGMTSSCIPTLASKQHVPLEVARTPWGKKRLIPKMVQGRGI